MAILCQTLQCLVPVVMCCVFDATLNTEASFLDDPGIGMNLKHGAQSVNLGGVWGLWQAKCAPWRCLTERFFGR